MVLYIARCSVVCGPVCGARCALVCFGDPLKASRVTGGPTRPPTTLSVYTSAPAKADCVTCCGARPIAVAATAADAGAGSVPIDVAVHPDTPRRIRALSCQGPRKHAESVGVDLRMAVPPLPSSLLPAPSPPSRPLSLTQLWAGGLVVGRWEGMRPLACSHCQRHKPHARPPCRQWSTVNCRGVVCAPVPHVFRTLSGFHTPPGMVRDVTKLLPAVTSPGIPFLPMLHRPGSCVCAR